MFTFIFQYNNDFSYMPIGGLSQLAICFSIYYQKTKPVKIVTKKNSFIYKYCVENGIRFNYYDINENYYDFIKDDDILVITYRDYFPMKLKSNPYVLFWGISPHMFFKWIGIPFDKKLFNNAISKLIMKMMLIEINRKKSLYFMDNTCKLATESNFKIELGWNILPVPILLNENEDFNIRNKNHPVKTITYLGRGNEIWKVKPVKYIYECLSKEYSTRDFKLIIITDYNKLFENELCKILVDNIQVEYINGLYGETLSEYLRKESDLHFAMGLSALEGSKNGLPTINIDGSYNDFPQDYKFRWLFNNYNYSLGNFIHLMNANDYRTGMSIRDIIDLLDDKKKYMEIAKECYNYTVENHSFLKIMKKIDDIIPSLSAKYRDIKKYLL